MCRIDVTKIPQQHRIEFLAPVAAGARLYAAEQLATRLVDLTNDLSVKHAAEVEKRVLPRAPHQTISQFTACIRRAVLAVDPATAEEKHVRSREDRRVVVTPPGDVDGDPVTASVARAMAFDPTSRWRRLLHDNHRRLIDVSSNTYQLPAPTRRFVQMRDRTCRFPTCQRAAVRCEEDHTIAWRLSHDTSPRNLVCLCLRHHHLKHDTRWNYTRADDGTITWTSSSGHHYLRPPPQPSF